MNKAIKFGRRYLYKYLVNYTRSDGHNSKVRSCELELSCKIEKLEIMEIVSDLQEEGYTRVVDIIGWQYLGKVRR